MKPVRQGNSYPRPSNSREIPVRDVKEHQSVTQHLGLLEDANLISILSALHDLKKKLERKDDE